MRIRITSILLIISLIACSKDKHVNSSSYIKEKKIINEQDMHKIKLENYARRMENAILNRYTYRDDDGMLPDSLYYIFLSNPQYYKHTSKDLEELITLIEVDLHNKGYKKPSDAYFLDRIKLIFGVDPKVESPLIRVHENYFLTLTEEIYTQYENYQEDFEFNYTNKIYSTKYNFMLFSSDWALNYDNVDGEIFEDFLYHIPTELSPYVLHRNKYLFNESNSSLTWLKINDEEFLESLVMTFGYVKDENLLKWVLDRNLYNYQTKENFDNFLLVLTNQRCDGSWVFNQEVLDIIDLNYNREYYDSIDEFALKFIEDKFNSKDEMPFEFKTEIIAKLLYWLEDNYDYDNDIQFQGFRMKRAYLLLGRVDEFEKEVKRNNYYNLPHFKEYWSSGISSIKTEEYD